MPPVARTEDPGPAGLDTMETELAMLTRALEGLSRQSAIYRDLDRSGYVLARTLVAEEPMSITGLATRLGLDATTVTRQVAAMETAGVVRRRRDERDARVSLIELTPLGRRRMESVRRARTDRIGRLVAGWPAPDVARFGALLGRLNDAMRADPSVR